MIESRCVGEEVEQVGRMELEDTLASDEDHIKERAQALITGEGGFERAVDFARTVLRGQSELQKDAEGQDTIRVAEEVVRLNAAASPEEKESRRTPMHPLAYPPDHPLRKGRGRST